MLPFKNMSGDPEQEYFADGMVEDIITALSRFRWFFVIARNSSFTYKGKAVDVQPGGARAWRALRARRLRPQGRRPRSASPRQLIEAETGNHIWADRYDGALEDVFDLQDRITEGVVGAVVPSVRRSRDRARAKEATRCPPPHMIWCCAHDLSSANGFRRRRSLALKP